MSRNSQNKNNKPRRSGDYREVSWATDSLVTVLVGTSAWSRLPEYAVPVTTVFAHYSHESMSPISYTSVSISVTTPVMASTSTSTSLPSEVMTSNS